MPGLDTDSELITGQTCLSTFIKVLRSLAPVQTGNPLPHCFFFFLTDVCTEAFLKLLQHKQSIISLGVELDGQNKTQYFYLFIENEAEFSLFLYSILIWATSS